MHRSTPHSQYGLTLLELTVVLLVLIGLGGLMLPFVGGTGQYAQCTATEAGMRAIRDAIVGSFEQPGYFENMRRLPSPEDDQTNFSLQWLINQGTGASKQPEFNPVTERGWLGPYLSTTMQDAYNLNDIVLQVPEGDGTGTNANNCSVIDAGYSREDCARLVSLGVDGTLQTDLDDADGRGRGDDRLLYLFIADPRSDLSQPCQELL